MMGKSQGETEIPFTWRKVFSRRVKLLFGELSSIGRQDQRISSVARHPFAGTLGKRRPRRLSECKPADLETDDRVY